MRRCSCIFFDKFPHSNRGTVACEFQCVPLRRPAGPFLSYCLQSCSCCPSCCLPVAAALLVRKHRTRALAIPILVARAALVAVAVQVGVVVQGAAPRPHQPAPASRQSRHKGRHPALLRSPIQRPFLRPLPGKLPQVPSASRPRLTALPRTRPYTRWPAPC